MSLLTDILKEIPQAVVLKEKISDIEAKYAAADTENAILKDDLRKANAEITKLKKQIEDLTHKDDLDQAEIDILKRMADMGVDVFAMDRVQLEVAMTPARLRLLINRLREKGYAEYVYGDDWGAHYAPTQKGLELLAAKDLI